MLRAAFFAQAVGQAMQLAGSMPDRVDICRKLSGALVGALERLAVEVSSFTHWLIWKDFFITAAFELLRHWNYSLITLSGFLRNCIWTWAACMQLIYYCVAFCCTILHAALPQGVPRQVLLPAFEAATCAGGRPAASEPCGPDGHAFTAVRAWQGSHQHAAEQAGRPARLEASGSCCMKCGWLLSASSSHAECRREL